MTDIHKVQDTAARVWRTIIQVGIPAFLTFAVAFPAIIDALGLPLNSKVYLWLIAAAGVITAVAGGLSRVMAIPVINAWLAKFKLSAPTVPVTPVVESPESNG